MQQHFFTDREIEEYLDGMFQGDADALQAYLQTTEGQKRLAYHKALYSVLQAEAEPQLRMSLSNAVLDTLERRKEKSSVQWSYILWLIGAVAALILLFYCFRFLGNFSFLTNAFNSSLWPVIIIMTLLIVAFQTIDIREKQRRFKKLIDQGPTIT